LESHFGLRSRHARTVAFANGVLSMVSMNCCRQRIVLD
jgi:hypothetical protein